MYILYSLVTFLWPVLIIGGIFFFVGRNRRIAKLEKDVKKMKEFLNSKFPELDRDKDLVHNLDQSDEKKAVEKEFAQRAKQSLEAVLPETFLSSEKVKQTTISNNKLVPSEVSTEVAKDGDNWNPEIDPNALLEWLKKDWLMKLGGIFLILALVWFVSYAFANDWVGPTGRIFMGLGAGIFFIILGEIRKKVSYQQSTVLVIMGMTFLLATIYSARAFYDMFTPTVALILMTMTVLYTAVSSIMYDDKVRGYLASLLYVFFPLMTVSSSPDPKGGLLYVLIVSIGIAGINILRGWKGMLLTQAATSICFIIMILGTFQITSTDFDMGMKLLLFAFPIVFLLSNILAVAKGSKVDVVDLVLAGINSFLGLYLIEILLEEGISGIVTLFSGLGAILLAYGLTQKSKNYRDITYVYLGVFIVYTAVATFKLLDGQWERLALIIEGFLLPFLSHKLFKNYKVAVLMSLSFGITVIFTMEPILKEPGWLFGMGLLYLFGLFGMLGGNEFLENNQIKWNPNRIVLVLFTIFYAYSFSNLNMVVNSGLNGRFQMSLEDLFLYTFNLGLMAWIGFSLLRSREREVYQDKGHSLYIFPYYLIALSGMLLMYVIWPVAGLLGFVKLTNIIALVVVAIIGFSLYVSSEQKFDNLKNMVGTILLGIVIFRVVFIESASLEIAYRILLYALTGIIFLASAYFIKNKSNNEKIL